jgi:hypothetical protein
LSFVGLAAACGGDESDGQSTGIAVDKFAEAYQQAACEHAVACNYMPDVDTCLASMAPSQRVVQGVAAVTSGALTYDEAAAKTCVDAVTSASCTQGSLFPKSLRQTCDAVFGGRKADGESCYHSIECDGVNAVCEGECFDSCCTGTCKADSSAVANLGEACDALPCNGDEAYCGSDPMTGMPVCLALVGAGGQCPDQGTCVVGYECDPSSATCFKQAPEGGMCNPSLQARVCSNIGEYCDATATACTKLPGAGDPCVMGTNACARFAFCDAGTCKLLPKAGEPCPGNVCLGDLECSSDQGDGACQALPAVVTCSAG